MANDPRHSRDATSSVGAFAAYEAGCGEKKNGKVGKLLICLGLMDSQRTSKRIKIKHQNNASSKQPDLTVATVAAAAASAAAAAAAAATAAL
mmetsp:Transcript_109894/g.212745  ORF Transcript_109894/g.212745 Transcript_109894/m.212745 type:complete len:92 (+) Transcript_109894:38-313(+)